MDENKIKQIEEIFNEFDQNVSPDEDERILDALKELGLTASDEAFLFVFKKYRDLKRVNHYGKVESLPEGVIIK